MDNTIIKNLTYTRVISKIEKGIIKICSEYFIDSMDYNFEFPESMKSIKLFKDFYLDFNFILTFHTFNSSKYYNNQKIEEPEKNYKRFMVHFRLRCPNDCRHLRNIILYDEYDKESITSYKDILDNGTFYSPIKDMINKLYNSKICKCDYDILIEHSEDVEYCTKCLKFNEYLYFSKTKENKTFDFCFCEEDIQSDKPIMQCSCNYIMHLECYEKLSDNIIKNCPKCRTMLTSTACTYRRVIISNILEYIKNT
jgi:hypothetical protein